MKEFFSTKLLFDLVLKEGDTTNLHFCGVFSPFFGRFALKNLLLQKRKPYLSSIDLKPKTIRLD
jgi:hypothetical protein